MGGQPKDYELELYYIYPPLGDLVAVLVAVVADYIGVGRVGVAARLLVDKVEADRLEPAEEPVDGGSLSHIS